MSKGLSPKLPLQKDPIDGYALNKNYVSMTTQNIKMLILTAPGERIMQPEFGVGLRNFLFLNDSPKLRNDIRAKINEQVKRFMPFIEVGEILIDEIENNPNSISVKMNFRIIPLDINSYVEINTSVN